jgi:hypothetical protein
MKHRDIKIPVTNTANRAKPMHDSKFTTTIDCTTIPDSRLDYGGNRAQEETLYVGWRYLGTKDAEGLSATCASCEDKGSRATSLHNSATKNVIKANRHLR